MAGMQSFQNLSTLGLITQLSQGAANGNDFAKEMVTR